LFLAAFHTVFDAWTLEKCSSLANRRESNRRSMNWRAFQNQLTSESSQPYVRNLESKCSALRSGPVTQAAPEPLVMVAALPEREIAQARHPTSTLQRC